MKRGPAAPSAGSEAAAVAAPAGKAKGKAKASKTKGGDKGSKGPAANAGAPAAADAAADGTAGEESDAASRLAVLDELLEGGLITRAEYDEKKSAIAPAAHTDAAPAKADLAKCSGCGELFLPHLLPKHQRSCSEVKAVKKTVKFVERPLPKPQDPYSSDTPDVPAAIERELASVEFADNGSNSFVACDLCGRTFFPDRLPIHMRICKGGKPKKAQESEAAARMAVLDELLEGGLVTKAEYDQQRAAILKVG